MSFAVAIAAAVLFVGLSTAVALGGWPGSHHSPKLDRHANVAKRTPAARHGARRHRSTAVTLGGRRPSHPRAAAGSPSEPPARAATRSRGPVAKPAPRAVKPVQRLASITPDPAPAPVAKPRIRPAPVQAPAAVPPPPASTPAPPPAPDLLADTIKQVDDAAGKLDQTLKGMLSPPPQPPAGG